MHLSEERIYYLLKSYTEGVATEAEEKELYDWAAATPDDQQIKDHVLHLVHQDKETFDGVDWDSLYDRIKKNMHRKGNFRSLKRRRRLRAAAAFLILIIGGGSGYLFMAKEHQPPVLADNTTKAAHYNNDIKPGGTRAVLQTANSSVTLTGADTVFTLAGNRVQINDGGVLVSKTKAVQYQLIVPRGGTYHTVLSDGTKVWLNADSKLSFPSTFRGSRREVVLIGEAYFEVSQDAVHPFIVKLPSAAEKDVREIKVLGTAFNVATYGADGNVTTTLINGKVQVKNDAKQMILLPGQQAIMSQQGTIDLNTDVDVEQVVAWKNGYFRFDKADIHTIMDQLARWYDIKVSYSGDLQPKHFGAIISRDNNISGILKMLEATGEVHFKIEGNEVTVMP